MSDAFGVDLIVTEHLEALKKREEENDKADQYDFDHAGSVLQASSENYQRKLFA